MTEHMELYSLTIKEASDKLAKGEITSVELVESFFERIAQVEPKVGAYITLCKSEALEAAKASDERRKSGKLLSDLDGIPVAVKDLILTKNIKTTAASKMLEDYIPPYNATVYRRLTDAGAILIGKTNLDEYAMGSSTENSAMKETKNPWDLTRVPGGSSGGSAAAVAADECMLAIGTDTGGSIRQPASFCSVSGLKVSYGLVSRYGVISYASSFDTIGPFAKSVEDIALVLPIIAGNDPKDSTSVTSSIPKYSESLTDGIKGKKIGIPKEFFGEGLNPEVSKVLESAKETFRGLGAEIVEVSLPLTDKAIAAYYILVKSEASSNLSRYDGIRYGYSALSKCHPELDSGSLDSGSQATVRNDSVTLAEVYFNSRESGFGPEPKRSIMMGTHTLSSGYFDAYYKNAAKVRTKIREEYKKVFEEVDILLTPVSPFPPFKIGEKVDDPLSMYLADVNTAPINVAGVPALSIPAGFTTDNLPIGMQLVGPMWGEQAILNAGYAFQQATDHHLKKPNL